MELIANVWPVADESTRIVQRYFMRAHAVEADDGAISALLNILAPADFRIAKLFTIPKRFSLTSEHGVMHGVVTLSEFHAEREDILEEAFRHFENNHAKVQGLDMRTGVPHAVNVVPRFPENPYLLTTVLLETLDGQLLPQLS